MMNDKHLNDAPDWRYLLMECYELYRHLDSGGSDQIRSHQRQVREAISRTMKSNPHINTEIVTDKPVTKHLNGHWMRVKFSFMHLIRSFESIHDRLNWRYG